MRQYVEVHFHGGTLLRVLESRRASSPSSLFDAASGDAVTEDVHLRVFLPSFPVGVARVEAVWSVGPARYRPPRHPTYFEASVIELNGIL